MAKATPLLLETVTSMVCRPSVQPTVTFCVPEAVFLPTRSVIVTVSAGLAAAWSS